MSKETKKPYKLGKLNVIVRFHNPQKITDLSHCLLSLYGQDYEYTQPVIALQDFSREDCEKVLSEIDKYPWKIKHEDSYPIIVNCKNPENKDIRSKLINEGIKNSDGQFLAILDYDDVIYGDAYTFLISRIKSDEKNIMAFGNIIRTDISPINGFYYQERKISPFIGESRSDMFVENFCPIHSFVIDRSRAPESEMYFDESMAKNEDYHFLVRLLADNEADFTSRSKFVGEYFVRTDGSNTINSEYSAPESNKSHEWEKAHLKMQELFEERTAKIRISDIRYLKLKALENSRNSSQQTLMAYETAKQNAEERLLREQKIRNTAVISAIKNAPPSRRKIDFHIDEIKTESNGTIEVTGWCVDLESKTSPEIVFLISNQRIFISHKSLERPDVCQHFGSRDIKGFHLRESIENSASIAHQITNKGVYFGAIFDSGEIFIKEIQGN